MNRGRRTQQVRDALRRRRSRPPVGGEPRLSVVIPAYGEAARIGAAIARVRHELSTVADDGGLQIVVVDDGSDDGTAVAARAAGADVVVEQEINGGKGSAVRAGVLASTGRTVAFTDADLAYNPGQIAGLLAEVEAGWDVVVGSRYHVDTKTVVRARPLREIGGRAVNQATRLVLLGGYDDTQCGLKAFRADVARVLFSQGRIDGFAFDIELLALVERYGFSLSEHGVVVENSERSTVSVVRDAYRMLIDLWRIRRFVATGAYDLPDGRLEELVPTR